jgi:PAS domain S-box-containing protein
MGGLPAAVTSSAISDKDDSRYRTLINSITDYAIFMLDVDGRVSSWNTGAERSKGYDASEIIGEHFSRFYTEEERRAGVPARALHIAATEGRYETEGWRLRKDGSRFWAHVIMDPIREPLSLRVVGFAKITRDLTERKKAADALRQSEQQFRILVQGVTDYAIYLLDSQGNITSWNAGAERIKGYAPDEIIGQHFSKFYTEEDRVGGLPAKSLATAAREGRYEKEGWRVRKDGSRFVAHVIIDAIRNDAGVVIGYAKVTRDITERIRAQAELQQAQQTLFHVQKLESIGQLTGGVAHDFNNLLTAILGSLDLLRKRLPSDPRAQMLLGNAVAAAERGSVLTQRMLSFARRQELRLNPVDLSTLVADMKDLMERSIGPSIQIRLNVDPALPSMQTDSNQLESALLNLVLNARDALPRGGQITISGNETWAGPNDARGLRIGHFVALTVADNGTGMDEATLARATEPFFTTKGVGKGTGLGLSMVHGLAEQSGGKLQITSTPGAGTRIDVWLPVSSEEERIAERLSNPPTPPVETTTNIILVVDDDDLVLSNTVAMLEDMGHETFQATSGGEALAIIAEHPEIDLVVTDHAMPGMTGMQLLHAVAGARPELRVVLATGFAELPSGTPQNLRRLAKPFRQRELTEVLAEALPVAKSLLLPNG